MNICPNPQLYLILEHLVHLLHPLTHDELSRTIQSTISNTCTAPLALPVRASVRSVPRCIYILQLQRGTSRQVD
jgi:hypothetical protein